MDGLKYEHLLRLAFGFAKNGRFGDRSCDPADLAEAGLLSDKNLSRVKIGAGYAFAILSTSAINYVAEQMEEGEYDRLHGFLQRVLSCASAAELSKIIAEFDSTIVKKYFDVSDGKIALKKKEGVPA